MSDHTPSQIAALARSAAVERRVLADPAAFRVLTGDRPTGPLHLGHYVGTLANRVRLQNLGVEVIVLIADYQVLTDNHASSAIADTVREIMADYLAAGIDPDRTTIFTHSAVPALNELVLPFLSLVSDAELHRNPTVRAEAEATGRPTSGLMLTYPPRRGADPLSRGAPCAGQQQKVPKSPAAPPTARFSDMADSERLDDEAAQALVRDLLERQGEDRNLHYKAAMAFASNEVKGKLLKCIMAFANTRDGGHILIGVEQKGIRFESTGVTEQQARSFDPTDVGNFARNYCSTLPRVTIRDVTIDGVSLLLIRVAEFADEPIVCTSDLHGADNKPVLRKGSIYVRTEDARCVAIDSSETMHSFLALAVQKYGEGLLGQIRGLVGAASITNASMPPSELYTAELASAEDLFEREDLTAPHAYWYCTVMPAFYDADRIPTTTRLREIRMQSEVALRGWNFPHTDRERNEPFEDGIESVTHLVTSQRGQPLLPIRAVHVETPATRGRLARVRRRHQLRVLDLQPA